MLKGVKKYINITSYYKYLENLIKINYNTNIINFDLTYIIPEHIKKVNTFKYFIDKLFKNKKNRFIYKNKLSNKFSFIIKENLNYEIILDNIIYPLLVDNIYNIINTLSKKIFMDKNDKIEYKNNIDILKILFLNFKPIEPY
jgi:hypothetical protein